MLPDCDAVEPTSQIPRLRNAEYEGTLRDLLGVTALSAFDDQTASAVLAADHDGDLTEIDWTLYQALGEAIAVQVMADPMLRGRFLGCDPSADSCLHDTIVKFGRRAFRRPLTDGEVARFEAIAARGAEITETGSAEEVAEVLLNTFLVSPSFLQRSELSEKPDANGHFVLSSHEVAARLSYMLWDSLPDADLDRAADAGELGSSDQIRAQAERMLEDPRAHGVVAAFHRGFLRMDYGWDGLVRDTVKYPAYSDAVVPAMRAETEKFFDTVVFRDEGTFGDLFTSRLGFVNSALAPLYGLDAGDYGDELEEVELDAARRPGFLTRVGFLAAHATNDRPSPTQRGAFICRDVLDIHFDPPDPDSSLTPIPPGDYTTNRQELEALTAAPECRGCHSIMDAPGFVLEAYDSVGMWQTTDPRGGEIDMVAEVQIDGEAVTIHDPAELMQAIAESSAAKRKYVERLVAFAYERDSESDACWVDTLAARAASPDYSVLDLLADLTQAPSFGVRARDP